MSAAFYYQNRADLLGDFITAAAARELLAEHDCVGDLDAGFAFCTRSVEGVALVPVWVKPALAEDMPPDVLARLLSDTDAP